MRLNSQVLGSPIYAIIKYLLWYVFKLLSFPIKLLTSPRSSLVVRILYLLDCKELQVYTFESSIGTSYNKLWN